jgi:prephenate dehydratase
MTARYRVAYQGEAGAFGEFAVRTHWGEDAVPVAARTFDDAIQQVADGSCDFAVLPAWNKTIGDISRAQQALRARADAVEACDEISIPVRHALLARPGATFEGVRWVGSHFAALGQCARFFEQHPRLTQVEAYDTAGAAKDLGEVGAGAEDATWFAPLNADPLQLAAIASAHAAAHYGLVVLRDGIQDDPENATRFAILRRKKGPQ